MKALKIDDFIDLVSSIEEHLEGFRAELEKAYRNIDEDDPNVELSVELYQSAARVLLKADGQIDDDLRALRRFLKNERVA